MLVAENWAGKMTSWKCLYGELAVYSIQSWERGPLIWSRALESFFFFHWLNLIVNSYCFVLQDFQDAYDLLQTNNVNHEKLLSYAREAANFSTNNQLPKLDFALNHYHKEDVAMFDFTSLYHSEHAAKIYERRGRRLLALVVGDSLLEVCIQKTQNVRCNDIISFLYLL